MKSKGRSPRVVRRTLADGTVKEYRYKRDQELDGHTLGAVIAQWQRSPEWSNLRPGTQANYVLYLKPLHAAMKLTPVNGIKRSHLLKMRNEIAFKRGHGAALNFCRAASALFTWARRNDVVEASPAIDLVFSLQRGSLPAWRDDQAQRAMRELPEPYRRAVVLAYHTGQRRGDLCRIGWHDYDGQVIRLTQEKTVQPLEIPASAELQAELTIWKADRHAVTILEFRGKPWRPSYLTQWLPAQLERIGLPPLGLHGLRRLTAIRLAEAGCTPHEIAAITGHRTLQMVQEYTKGVRQRNLADVAVLRLENAGKRKTPTLKRKLLQGLKSVD